MKLITKQDAMALLKQFVNERLDGKIDRLKEYDFRLLFDSFLFGCPGRPLDCDNSNLANAIYVILWSGILPDCGFETIGINLPYRGDTINTFNTFFGREMDHRPGFYAGLEKYQPDERLRERVRSFYGLCSTIGNFVMLPNISFDKKTINTHRGSNDWRDFFDQFLINLELCLKDGCSKDRILSGLIEKNAFFFNCFGGDDRLLQMAKILFLDDYFNASGNPREIFTLNYHWRDLSRRQEYLEAANIYLDIAPVIIHHRAEKMIAELKKYLDLDE